MDLVRDLLDKLVIDRNSREMGRVDGVILELRESAAPRVSGIEMGPAVIGRRLSPMMGRWVEALEHALGIDEGRPVHVPIGAIIEIGDDVKVDFAVTETGAGNLEQRLRRIVGTIPGSQ